VSIFTRLSDVFRANINALIDRAEDPEKMANQIILDLEKIQDDVTAQVANAIAEEKRLKNQVAQSRSEVDRWENRAMEALRQGIEDLAREAVRQKQRHDSDFNLNQDHHRQQVEHVDTLKNSLRELNLKLEEARRRRDQLIARSRSAQAQTAMAKTMQKMSGTGALSALERMEKKVQQQEGLVKAYAELCQDQDTERKFKDLEKNKAIEDQLAALKAKRGKE
jgi:phage shock protein A